MLVRDPNLQKFIEGLNKDVNSLSSQYADLNNKLEEGRWVDAKNGSKRRLLVKDLVAENYESIKEIKKDTEILRDFGKWHRVNKKYHLYKILTPPALLTGIGALYLLFHQIWELLF